MPSVGPNDMKRASLHDIRRELSRRFTEAADERALDGDFEGANRLREHNAPRIGNAIDALRRHERGERIPDA